MSDLQRDIEQVEWVMSGRTDDEPWAAWQRLRARLEAVPDREDLTAVLQDAASARFINIDHYDARWIVDAVIAAIKGDTK